MCIRDSPPEKRLQRARRPNSLSPSDSLAQNDTDSPRRGLAGWTCQGRPWAHASQAPKPEGQRPEQRKGRPALRALSFGANAWLLARQEPRIAPVSYTHLTLPTICSV
eukprot:8682373-Alexandrium_andersonii.AAC.1